LKYFIIGIHKCGTHSLQQYLELKGHSVLLDENFFRTHGVEDYSNNHAHLKPIIILRDPIERSWAQYNYKRLESQQWHKGYAIDPKQSFEEAVVFHPELIKDSQYKRILKEFELIDLEVVYLENFIDVKDFPHLISNPHPKVPDDLRPIIQKLLLKI